MVSALALHAKAFGNRVEVGRRGRGLMKLPDFGALQLLLVALSLNLHERTARCFVGSDP